MEKQQKPVRQQSKSIAKNSANPDTKIVFLHICKNIIVSLSATPSSVAILLCVITVAVYMFAPHGDGKHWNYFTLLADAFLHGRLHVLENPPWLNELALWQGRYYVVFPPMPAILLLPFVALFGSSFQQPILSILLAAANVSLAYLVFWNIFKKKDVSIWMAILYGFGTIQWYHAEVGSAWYFAHIVALFFLWLALHEVTTKARLFLVGFWIGCAMLARLPTVFAVFFVLVYCYQRFIDGRQIHLKSFFLLGLGILPALITNFLYNYLRFGTISDKAYMLLPVFDEPWYKYGLLDVRYIPIHLKEIFTALPRFQPDWPFVIPSVFAMAIWFTTPAFFLILFARFKSKLALASLAGLVGVALPSLMHGGNGFTQFGYRHTLDYMPFLLLLTASGMRGRVRWWMIVLIVLSILVNFWGVMMLSFFQIWTW